MLQAMSCMCIRREMDNYHHSMLGALVHSEVYSASAEAFKAENIVLKAIKCNNTCYTQELSNLELISTHIGYL